MKTKGNKTKGEKHSGDGSYCVRIDIAFLMNDE